MKSGKIKKVQFRWNRQSSKRSRRKSQTSKVPTAQQATSSTILNPVNREPMGHEEVVAMARRNQKAQKRPRASKQEKQTKKQATKAKQTAEAKTKNSPGNDKRPLWLKNARARLTKPSKAEEFARKSKEAALTHSRELRDQATRTRRLLYSSSLVNKSFTS